MENKQSNISYAIISLGDGGTVFRSGGIKGGGYYLDFVRVKNKHDPGDVVKKEEIDEGHKYLTIEFSNKKSLEVLVSTVIQVLEHVTKHEREEADEHQGD